MKKKKQKIKDLNEKASEKFVPQVLQVNQSVQITATESDVS